MRVYGNGTKQYRREVVTEHIPLEERIYDLTLNKLTAKGYNLQREFSLFEPVRDAAVLEFCKHFGIPLDDRLRVLMLAGDAQACGYYRVYLPAKYLKRSFGDKLSIVTSMSTITPELIRWADIIVVQRAGSFNQTVMLDRFARDRVVITEDDDNFFVIDENNPAYETLKQSSGILYLWMQMLKRADAHQVSTRAIADWMRGYRDPVDREKTLAKPTAILPNSLETGDSKRYGPTWKKGPVTIGWAGSTAHVTDLAVLNEPLSKIQRRYPNVKFAVIGWNGAAPAGKGKYGSAIPDVWLHRTVGAFPLEGFMEGLATEAFDIALAPLEDIPFNHGKSNLRLLQHALTGSPVVASDVGEYGRFRNALHVKRNDPELWEKAIAGLLDNPKLRGELIEGAKKEVMERYDIEKNTSYWAEFYIEMAKRFRKQLRNRVE